MKKMGFLIVLYISLLGFTDDSQAACESVKDCAQEAVDNAKIAIDTMKKLIPPGAVMAFNLEQCPAGWKTFEAGRGRYILGLPVNGSLGSTVGTELTDKENRAAGRHEHSFNFITEASGYRKGRGNKAGHSHAGKKSKTEENKDIKEGTIAPYVQLLLCENI